MVVYNTLTKKKEEFIPLEKNKVKMYACGPTVYNYITIGNARFYVVFDMVRRYLEYKGFDVVFVQNFTDVDDKIIKRSNQENVPAAEIASRFIEACVEDSMAMGIKKPTYAPKVTEEMDTIIEMIRTLVDKGFAYEVNSNVYYDTGKFPGYGELSGKNIDELEAGARVEINPDKKNPADFVLWKPAKAGEPKWPSPWGEGRPGWHIECSAMAKKYLGDTLDIHAGGEDLIFPHHENEIAQSEAANGSTFVNYWMHNGYINIDNRKMSKSLGNFFTLREVAEKFSYDEIRFFILSAHYRSPINFSDQLLQASKNGFERIKNCRLHLDFTIRNKQESHSGSETDVSGMTVGERELIGGAETFIRDFDKSMDDDFNTADAIAAIFELVKFANIHVTDRSSEQFTREIRDILDKLCGVLGIVLSDETDSMEGVNVAEVEELIEKRRQARNTKDWAAADAIRNRLSDMGVVLEDTPSGVKYHFK